MWKRATILLVVGLAACQPGESAPSVIRFNTPIITTITVRPSRSMLRSGEALILVEGDYDEPSLAALDMESGDVRIMIANVDDITNDQGFAVLPARSPDGLMIAFERQFIADIPGGQELRNDGIWLVETDGERLRQLAQPAEDQEFSDPVWSPDGTQISYSVSGPGRGLYVIPVDGGEATELVPFALRAGNMAWSPDGEQILFTSERRDESGTLRRGIYIYDVESETETPIIVEENVNFRRPAWSPDGERITYVRWEFEAELQEIFVSNADGSDAVNLMPGQAFAYDPQFSPDGTEIAYNHYDSENQTYSITVLSLDGESEPRTLVEVGANNRGPDW